jgi:hypothetical protein
MRPRNREIAIFSLSTLDVIFGALGAFMILMLAAMSSYNPDEQVVTQDELDDAKREQQTVTALIDWYEDADVDLWVESRGRLYGPKPEVFPGKADPEKKVDSTGPPGAENQMFSSAEGTYRVFYRLHLLRGDTKSVLVGGWVVVSAQTDVYRAIPLGRRVLSQVGELVEVVAVDVNAQGEVSDVRRSP